MAQKVINQHSQNGITSANAQNTSTPTNVTATTNNPFQFELGIDQMNGRTNYSKTLDITPNFTT